MRKIFIVFFVFGVLISTFSANAELKKSKPNPPQAVARGFSNLMFAWLEIPRGLVYENSRVPVVGFVSGALKGTLLTTWRVIAGTVDIVGMGLTREGLYADGILPEYVWDAPWIAPCGEDIIEPKTIRTSPCQGLSKKECLMQKKRKCKDLCEEVCTMQKNRGCN